MVVLWKGIRKDDIRKVDFGVMDNPNENRTSATHWNSVDWRKAEEEVRRLRQRIFRAERSGNARLVRSLQKLMLRSYSNRLVAVRRVTQQNRGKNTPGVDGVTLKTPAARGTPTARYSCDSRPCRAGYGQECAGTAMGGAL